MSKALFQVTGGGGVAGIKSECKKIRKHMEHKAGGKQPGWCSESCRDTSPLSSRTEALEGNSHGEEQSLWGVPSACRAVSCPIPVKLHG